LLLAALATSCSSIGVIRQTKDDWYSQATRSVLNSDDVSDVTINILRRRSLTASYRQDPEGAIRALQRELAETRERELCVAIAELGIIQTRRISVVDRVALGTAVRYSYAYLFDPQLEPAPHQFDAQFRWACDIYNFAIAEFVRASTQESRTRAGKPGLLEWYGGSAPLELGQNELAFALKDFEDVEVAYDFRVEGLPPPDSRRGLGVPVLLRQSWTKEEKRKVEFKYLPDHLAFAATILVRFSDDASVLDAQSAPGMLDVLDPMETVSKQIGGVDVPLEIDYTTPVASMLSGKPQAIGLRALFFGPDYKQKGGLYMFQPYRKGRIPILLVHGLASDPLTWLPLYNDLVADPVIRTRCQFLFWFYPTGQPVLFSGQQLRRALSEAYELVSPDDDDIANDWTLVCGHSLGGVLTRSLVVDTGDTLWDTAFEVPFDQLDGIAPRERNLLRDSFFFESAPYIRRAIFYATPHRGSPDAKMGVVQWMSGLIAVPSQTMDPLFRAVRKAKPKIRIKRLTSIQSLRDDNPIIQALADLPINPRTTYHSIIGDTTAGGHEGGSDGIVPYVSSHVPGAESELIVHSGHSVQQTPEAARETIRIVREHIAAFDAKR